MTYGLIKMVLLYYVAYLLVKSLKPFQDGFIVLNDQPISETIEEFSRWFEIPT